MLRYLDCLMRAHFLTAETADALFIIVDRRISAAVIKADGFPFHRAALDADAAFFTFFFYDIGAALEDPEDLEQVEGSFFAGFAAVDVEVWISVLSFQFFLGCSDRFFRYEFCLFFSSANAYRNTSVTCTACSKIYKSSFYNAVL